MTMDGTTARRVMWRHVAALLILATLTATAGHAQTSTACRQDCKKQKKACLAVFKDQFSVRKGECAATDGDRKACKKEAKSALKAARRDCKGAFKNECNPCCTQSASSCSVTVCGDGLAGATEECDLGDRVDGDGCSAECLLEGLPPGPLGTRVFSLAPESNASSRFVPDVGSPSGTIVLEALEPDAHGAAEVRSVGGPFFVTTDIDLPAFGLGVRICSKIESCTGTIHCYGGSNVDVIVELDSLAEGKTCERNARCAGAKSNCCENACEGFVDPDAPVVEAVGSGNPIVNRRVADLMPTADSGPGAMILTCQQINRPFDLTAGIPCDAQEYGDAFQDAVYTTGTTTARVLNQCAADTAAGEPGTAPDATLDLAATGQNLSCAAWSTENGPGVLANAIPQEEPTEILLGDTTFATVLHD